MWNKLLVVIAALGLVIVALVAYAALTNDSRTMFPDTPRPALAASTDPALIEQGRYLVRGPAHCAQCHSVSERARPDLVKTEPLHGGLAFRMGPIGETFAANLTALGHVSDADLARTLATGVTHTGEMSFMMRFAAARMSKEDIVAVMSYLRSLSPIKNDVPKGHWTLLGKVLLAYVFPSMTPRHDGDIAHVPASAEPSVERGAYLAKNVALCTACHSQLDMKTFQPVGPVAGGSNPDPSHGDDDQDMEYVAPNLTSHATGITGKMSEDDFVKRLKAGRVYKSSIMPWESIGEMTEGDLRSVYRFLKTLPPVDNDVGPTYRKRS